MALAALGVMEMTSGVMFIAHGVCDDPRVHSAVGNDWACAFKLSSPPIRSRRMAFRFTRILI